MDLLLLYKKVFALVGEWLGITMTIGGMNFSVGSFILFGLLASLFIWFLRQLGG